MKIINIKVKCGVCEQESDQNFCLSRNNFHCVTHLDSRCDNGVVDIPLQKCPHCNYVNFDIGCKANLTVKDVELEQENLKNFNSECQNYILAGLANEKINNKKDAGRAYLYASWIFEDLNDLKNADIYRRKACDMLVEQALREENEQMIMQCIDLYRKCGDYKEANNLLKLLEDSLKEVTILDENIKNDEQYKFIKNFLKFEKTKCSLQDNKDYLLNKIFDKISFIDFYSLFLRRSRFDNAECSMYAPIFYDMKDEYFDNVLECLNTGNCIKVTFNKYNTDDIINGYMLEKSIKGYLKALIILNNIEQFGEYGYEIFNPFIIE